MQKSYNFLFNMKRAYQENIFLILNHVYDYRPNCTPLSSITILNFAKVAFMIQSFRATLVKLKEIFS